jgi:hypothetical protein
MLRDVEQLLDEYTKWLRDKSQLREISSGIVEVTTPHLDRHNDCFQFYVKQDGNRYLLTDDGAVIRDLKGSGCSLDSKKRRELLSQTLNGFGVQLQGDEITVEATKGSFPLRKHNLVQAMLAVNDLFYLATPMVTSLFLEDVTNWLNANDVRFLPNVRFNGQSGYEHRFDFAIPSSKTSPERLVRAINRPDRDAAEAMVFAWMDTKAVRPEASESYALLNDVDSSVGSAVTEALTKYDVIPIPWSQREQYKQRLAA